KAVKKHIKATTPDLLARLRDELFLLDDWQGEALSNAVRSVAEASEVGMGKVAQPLRIALTGGPVWPSIDSTLELLGREETLARLDTAIAVFSADSGA